jgi:hypothetical protein
VGSVDGKTVMTLRNWRLPGRVTAALLCCLAATGALPAQQGATLTGVVTDRTTGNRITGAQIVLLREGRTAASDSSGKYVLSGLAAGPSDFVVRARGFPARQLAVELKAGETTERLIELDSTRTGRLAAAQVLPAVAVTAPATVVSYRLVGFERRRQTGRGQYLTEEEIIRSGAYNVVDAVKSMRGVLYECGGGRGCYVRMARAPMRCLPEFIVDDHMMNDFGPLTPIRDVIGLEVYTGPAEVPGEYAGRNAGCGVIVIWTRSGPTRKQP